jgi:hypothetical protein
MTHAEPEGLDTALAADVPAGQAEPRTNPEAARPSARTKVRLEADPREKEHTSPDPLFVTDRYRLVTPYKLYL